MVGALGALRGPQRAGCYRSAQERAVAAAQTLHLAVNRAGGHQTVQTHLMCVGRVSLAAIRRLKSGRKTASRFSGP